MQSVNFFEEDDRVVKNFLHRDRKIEMKSISVLIKIMRVIKEGLIYHDKNVMRMIRN